MAPRSIDIDGGWGTFLRTEKCSARSSTMRSDQKSAVQSSCLKSAWRDSVIVISSAKVAWADGKGELSRDWDFGRWQSHRRLPRVVSLCRRFPSRDGSASCRSKSCLRSGFLCDAQNVVGGAAYQVLLAQMVARKRLVEANAKVALGETPAALIAPGFAWSDPCAQAVSRGGHMGRGQWRPQAR